MTSLRPRVHPTHRTWPGVLLTIALAACTTTPPPGPASPSVRAVNPRDGATGVDTTTSVTADVQLLSAPGGGNGIDPRTVTSSAVRLLEASTNTAVPATTNTSGGGDVIVLHPNAPLKANTKYRFEVTGALKDLNGVGFQTFTSSFTTGAAAVTGPSVFTKVTLASVPARYYTALEIGPDHKLYAATLTGEILRFAINADGTLGAPQSLTALQAQQGNRSIIGLKFDPASTADNLVLWISNNYYYDFTKQVPDWTGKITRLSGPNLETVRDVVIGLPRSTKDHMTNNVSFNPKEPNVLYFVQGANNASGAPDPAWDNRPERLLSAALLRLDLSKLNLAGPPLNVQTEEGGTYNPYASGAPLTLHATGIRNGYSLVWHGNGQLYIPANGSAAGGNTPATPSPLPAACANRADGRTALPAAPAVTGLNWTEPDFLFRIDRGGYYGHPNPARCEYTLDGGNPTGGTDAVEVPDYPVGVQPDPNYRLPAFVFPEHTSANGVIEYTRPGSALDGRLLVVRYSAGKDIVALDPSGPGGSIVGSMQTNIEGLTNFNPSPLNLTEDRSNGNLYVAQLSEADPNVKGTITLVRPK
ncbi:Ig-like domain-containing protein [Deinococcus planocerae]|uniref:Ig-like domain-containing protein n=1 Tax=Deinococcus planocerae TaxID=1737569 RepID=UPI000C7F43D9|nr:Ig-like domain-containing protein [Deinococcus planocerae]